MFSTLGLFGVIATTALVSYGLGEKRAAEKEELKRVKKENKELKRKMEEHK